jgi:hypothetical protein
MHREHSGRFPSHYEQILVNDQSLILIVNTLLITLALRMRQNLHDAAMGLLLFLVTAPAASGCGGSLLNGAGKRGRSRDRVASDEVAAAEALSEEDMTFQVRNGKKAERLDTNVSMKWAMRRRIKRGGEEPAAFSPTLYCAEYLYSPMETRSLSDLSGQVRDGKHY